MDITALLQNHWKDIGATLAVLHLILGIAGNFGAKVQGIDDVITNLIKSFFNSSTPPKA